MLETVVVDCRLDVQLNGLDGNDVGYITAFPSASIFSFTPMIGAKKSFQFTAYVVYFLCGYSKQVFINLTIHVVWMCLEV